MLILTIVQKKFKLPHLEIPFLETSYLGVFFGLCRPIIYSLDDLFQNFLQIVHLPMEFDIW